MKQVAAVLFVLAFSAFAPVTASDVIAKVLSMIGDLEAKTIEEGKVAQKEYDEYAEWCEDTSKELQYEIKTGKSMVEELTATISEESSNIEAADAKIEDLGGAIAKAEKELKEATGIRETEAEDFAAIEKELVTAKDMIERAIGILEKELAKGASALLQLKGTDGVLHAMRLLIDSAAINASDGAKLTALVQQKQQSKSDSDADDSDSDSDDDMELGAPAAKAYESKAGGIVEVLEGMLADAEKQLEDARKKEEKAVQNFEMLKQSLTDEIMYGNADMDATKKAKEASMETKATAEGDLSNTKADLSADEKELNGLHADCMTHANDFEVETTSRGEELKALATAKKIIKEATSLSQTSVSFLQTRKRSNDVTSFTVVSFIKDLAQKKHSAALSQLAARMHTAVRLGGSESDVFAKIKSMISDMIAKLEKEAAEAAGEKEYCDKETKETTAKKEDNEALIKKLTTKIDQLSADSAKLKEEVATLQGELAAAAASFAEAQKLRQEEKEIFEKNKAELDKGIGGLKQALKVLNDYYSKDAAHGSSGGASSGIISLLEVALADMEKELSEITQVEDTAAAEFEKMTKEGELVKVTKEQDVKYKTKEATSLDKTVDELSGDLAGVQSEQEAVLEYLAKINKRCIAKPDSYEEIKKRREEEIAGLQEGLEVLESETALVQLSSKHTLRGAHKH